MFRKQAQKMEKARDLGVLGAFIGAIAVLLFVGCYVVYRLAGERAYHEKWKDYHDCGWA